MAGSGLGPVLLLALGLVACGSEGQGTGVATNPSTFQGSPVASAVPAVGGVQTSGARTVLSPIGINIRDADAPTATLLGTAGRGTLLTVLDHSDRNGGWYKVRGETTVGWITADPDLTAPGHFSNFESDQLAFSALYPDQWTFATEPADVVFKPQSGSEAIVVRPAPALAALGPAGRAGYAAATQSSVVVCGVTGNLVGYDRGGSGAAGSIAATPAPGAPAPVSAPQLAHFAQLRLRLDAGHALELDYNYDEDAQLQLFRNLFNSVTFPFPQCMQTATPAASPGAH